MSPQDNDITPAMLLRQMQKMGDGLQREMKKMGEDLQQEVIGVKQDVRGLREVVDRHHELTMTAFDNIDKRLDDLEVVEIPALKKAVGMK